MNTQCPHCHTVFRIAPAQIEAAGGRVRCSQCRTAFDARARLQKELPLDADAGEHEGPRRGEQPGLNLGEPPAGTVSGVLLSDLGSSTPVRARRS
ncbi:MAG: MJ0042-type zinc finger domain-containing protein, partial [Halofilum sp. (in: g-proteobacteria)]